MEKFHMAKDMPYFKFYSSEWNDEYNGMDVWKEG
jgi:hypothetical protein